MDERYPYIRFVIDAAQVIAGAVALIVLLGGTVSSCHCGGFHGLVSFVMSVGIAAVAYVVVMVCIETLRVFLDIESAARQTLAAQRPPAAPGSTA
ncbi:MAG: hypothetical protein ACHQ4J_05415 [Candidatus Binatia bacterium]